jgi:trigger factor
MNFELNVEETSAIRRRLHFTLPGDVVRGELDRAYRDLKKRIRLPGFRPGKVPRNLLENRYGKQVQGEVAGRLIEQSVREAFADLDVAGRPSVEEQGEVLGGTEFTFVIGVDVRPEVEVEGYNGLELTRNDVSVSDEIVDAQIQRQLASKARIDEVTEDRPVEEGDLVLAELKLEADGDTLAEDAGTLVNSAGDQFYPGVEALLIGLKKDESKNEEITIGAETALEDLAGVTCQATVKVLGIQARVMPEPSELAEELGFEGVDEMKTSMRQEMEQSASDSARHAAQVQALEKLVQINGFEVPEGMVEEHLEALLKEFKMQRAFRGEDPRGIQFSPEELDDFRNRARFAAKASLILESVARAEKLVVEDGDVDNKIKEIAENRGQEIDAIRGYLMNDENLPRLKDLIVEEKTMSWLMDHAKFSVSKAKDAAE